jgi:hypothetical protein
VNDAAALHADLCRKIAAADLAAAILPGGVSLGVGLLNAACMSYGGRNPENRAGRVKSPENVLILTDKPDLKEAP